MTEEQSDKRKKSARDKAQKMLFTHQLDAFMNQGVFPIRQTLYYPTPSHTEDERGEVETGGMRHFIKGMEFLRMCYPADDIRVILHTPGGYDYNGFAVYDAIRDPRHKNRVIIEGTGMVMSMGVFILQAGHRRILHRHTRLMIHYGTWEEHKIHSKDFIRSAKECELLCDIYRDLLLQRIREKQPEFTSEKMEKLMAHDHYFSAEEAVALGLADEVIN